MVETGASGVRKTDFSAVAEDIIPSVDDTFDLGAPDKRWATIWVVLALVTSLVIGGSVALTNLDNTLLINASTNISGDLDVNGYVNASDWTDVSITEIQISDLQTYLINGTAAGWQLGFTTGNFTGNLTLKDDLILDQGNVITLGAGIITYNGTCVIVNGSSATLEIC